MQPIAKALLIASVVTACGGGSPTEGTPPPGGGGGGGGGSTPVATTAVTIQGSAFAPPAIRVAPGAVVTWNNTDGIDHNVSFASTAVTDIASWSSGSRTTTMPATAGTYPYSCSIHAGMSGSVQVQ